MKFVRNLYSITQELTQAKVSKSTCEISIIDDDPFYCMMTQEVIKEQGYTNIKTFSCGEDYLNDLKEPSKNQQIVFLDHNMTGISGFELLKKIRTHNLKIKVIMLSAQEDMKLAIQSFENGAFCYINKGDSVEEKIEKVLSRIQETLVLQKKQAQSNWKKIIQLLSVETLLFFQPSSYTFMITLFTTVSISVVAPVVFEKLSIVIPYKQFLPYVVFIISTMAMMYS